MRTSNADSESALCPILALPKFLRWMQRPKPPAETDGVDLDSISEAEVEPVYAGLARLAAPPEKERHALVTHVLAEAEEEDA